MLLMCTHTKYTFCLQYISIMCIFIQVCRKLHLCALKQAGDLQQSHEHVDQSYNTVSSPSISLSTARGSHCCVGTSHTCCLNETDSSRGGFYVLSFRMTVAMTRKKVFQPRVVANPRHTSIRLRPQPLYMIQRRDSAAKV